MMLAYARPQANSGSVKLLRIISAKVSQTNNFTCVNNKASPEFDDDSILRVSQNLQVLVVCSKDIGSLLS